MKHAALIELNGFHSDCIYSQVLFLKKKGYTVHLICNQMLEGMISDIHIADHVMLTDNSLKSWWQIRNYLVSNRIPKVIFNTSQGSKVMRFSMLPFPRWMTFYGILHDLEKLSASRGQMWINRRVKHYFVLADFLSHNFPGNLLHGHHTVTPAFLPDYPQVPITKKPGEIWYLVPGALDNERRDYLSLFQEGAHYDEKVKFILLGNSHSYDGPRVKQMIAERGWQDRFILFDHFVPNSEFYSYAKMCDYVMLLVHDNATKFESYLTSKITGSMLIALALRKPMLCDKAFSSIPDYAPHSIFYDRSELASTVNNLEIPKISEYYDEAFDRKFDPEVRAEDYVNFLENPYGVEEAYIAPSYKRKRAVTYSHGIGHQFKTHP